MKNFFNIFSREQNRTGGEEKTPDENQVAVAVCALLLEMAGIDGEFSETERKQVFSVLRKQFHLEEGQVEELTRLASKELEGSLDLWNFTNRINQYYSTEEKIKLVELLWRIIYADKKLDKYEDYLIHRLSGLLRLSHKQLIEAKLNVLNPGD